MNIPIGGPAESAEPLYLPTDVTPEQLFQAIGRLRKDARDEIDRLIRFLDKTDDYVSRELEDDDDREAIGDDEPSLGSFDLMTDQSKSWLRMQGAFGAEDDAEQDDADAEPSLGSVERSPSIAGWRDGPNPTGDQTQWAAGGGRDLEGEHDGCEPGEDSEPDDTGIGDQDGLDEQVPFQDWQGVGMV
jgi:hypothetical protein